MDLGIKGESALVLASSRGLGFGCAKALSDEGVRVVLNGLSEENGAKAVKAIGGDTIFVSADVSKAEDRERLWDEALDHLGEVSILVTNAYGPQPGPFMDRTNEDWRTAFEETFISAIDMAYRAAPPMVERGWGRIINISSMSAKEPSTNTPLGNSLKAGLLGAFGTLAREIAAKGVTVNSLLPGPFDTDLLRPFAKYMVNDPSLSDDEGVRKFAETVPVKRLGKIEEFGAVCAFLCSRHAGYVTAQAISVDGAVVKTML
ncbi:MAG: SDR family oxidoreductase [Rhodospirillaceae bacterium]|jgi:3-oxoacyl-[acyl-carrier protein] reductase|nr:SDR family oxidoreductase [Rhodospirillaceae bacterium]MBT6117186.1 SDR family oxidoreductase [Rhodospirillaceae bacterium]